ncbi:hypothetical protein [Bradyrhizobium sp. CCBAU 65884]|uniref:hypothetical protein n=1 Tax=Bradyrhizobium sp. CCBAU 65884 TaxID=722477 RepID=UPI002305C2C3|nr:hypothetical protein [Bradyrhizobium sp. CCBAU 65884]
MADVKLPFLHSFKDSRGKRRHVFRRKGHKTVSIKGSPGSSEFLEAYQALLEKTGDDPPSTIGGSKAKSDTIDAWVIAYFKHETFTDGLAKDT